MLYLALSLTLLNCGDATGFLQAPTCADKNPCGKKGFGDYVLWTTLKAGASELQCADNSNGCDESYCCKSATCAETKPCDGTATLKANAHERLCGHRIGGCNVIRCCKPLSDGDAACNLAPHMCAKYLAHRHHSCSSTTSVVKSTTTADWSLQCMSRCENVKCDFFLFSYEQSFCQIYQSSDPRLSFTHQSDVDCYVPKREVGSGEACVKSDICGVAWEECVDTMDKSALCTTGECLCTPRITKCSEVFCGTHSTCIKTASRLYCSECHDGYTGMAPHCTGTGLCAHSTHLGDRCQPSPGEAWDGFCTLEFHGMTPRNVATLMTFPISTPVCKRRYDGNHGEFLNVSAFLKGGYAPLRPIASIKLPADVGKSFAVMVHCDLLSFSPDIPRQIYGAGARLVLVARSGTDQEKCMALVDRYLRGHCTDSKCERIQLMIADAFPGSMRLWIRDYGPFYLLEKREMWTRLWVADFDYFSSDRSANDFFPVRLGKLLGQEVLMNTLRYLHIEGSNILSNGMGKCIIGKKVFCQNAKWLCELAYNGGSSVEDYWGRFDQKTPLLEDNGWGPMDFNFTNLGSIFDEIASRPSNETFPLKRLVGKLIENLLKEHFGCTHALFMEGVPHDAMDRVDMLYFWLDENTVLMGTYSASVFTDKANVYLERYQHNRKVLQGAGLVVREVPMPPPSFHFGSLVVYTYLSGIVVTSVANTRRTLLMPTYKAAAIHHELCEECRRKTVQIYEEYNFMVVPVDVTRIQGFGSSIRIATSMVPYIEGECARESKSVQDYFACLEAEIPPNDKMDLRDREFQAEVKMRNIITQREWNCQRNESAPLRCDLSAPLVWQSQTA